MLLIYFTNTRTNACHIHKHIKHTLRNQWVHHIECWVNRSSIKKIQIWLAKHAKIKIILINGNNMFYLFAKFFYTTIKDKMSLSIEYSMFWGRFYMVSNNTFIWPNPTLTVILKKLLLYIKIIKIKNNNGYDDDDDHIPKRNVYRNLKNIYTIIRWSPKSEMG